MGMFFITFFMGMFHRDFLSQFLRDFLGGGDFLSQFHGDIFYHLLHGDVFRYHRQADLHHVQLAGSLNKSEVSKFESTLHKLWNQSVYEEQKLKRNVSVSVVGIEDTIDMTSR